MYFYWDPLTLSTAYPEIGDANFKCALWTIKQQLEFLLFSSKCVCNVPFGIHIDLLTRDQHAIEIWLPPYLLFSPVWGHQVKYSNWNEDLKQIRQ